MQKWWRVSRLNDCSESIKPSVDSSFELDKKAATNISKAFRPLKPRKKSKIEETKSNIKPIPPSFKHMAEDDQESNMTINNKKVHFIAFDDIKSFQNRLSSSDDDLELYQISERPMKKYLAMDNDLNYINEEEGNSDGYDSDDSNRADQECYEYPDEADDEDEWEEEHEGKYVLQLGQKANR